jgi:hypothetical protein
MMGKNNGADRRGEGARIGSAVGRALDFLADDLPELLTLPDKDMLALETRIEAALSRAISPGPRVS